MTDLTVHQRASIAALQTDARTVTAPAWLARKAHIPNDAVERQFAAQEPEAFWREKAALVEWMEPFHTVSTFDGANHAWFLGGKLNATVNCIDRHVMGDKRLKAALIWVGKDGEE